MPVILAAAMALSTAPPSPVHAIIADTVWKGEVRVQGQLVVEKGVKLVILPGTKVLFLPGKKDEEGLSDSGCWLMGR
ncbi:MAG: hypothetical protein ABSG42_01755 [Nitrospirota bacterium]